MDIYRKRAQITLLIIALAVVAGTVFYWRFWSELTIKRALDVQQAVLDAISVAEPEKPVSTPPPLVQPKPSGEGGLRAPVPDSSALTRAGILAATNAERAGNGLPPLSGDPVLDAVAIGRLEDMFAKQYFDHVAPDGGKAEMVAKTSGYDFLALGENLALGIYDGDAGVVTAWMESPGHRANIVNTKYTELGVAARKGMFEGHETWLAVQIFGRPASDCPAPNASKKATIETTQKTLSEMEAGLTAKKNELESTYPKRGPAYNQQVDEDNATVEQYNALLTELKSQITGYNAVVSAYNACIGG